MSNNGIGYEEAEILGEYVSKFLNLTSLSLNLRLKKKIQNSKH